MESGRERVLKAIDHIQPEVTPVNLGGIYGLDRWLRRFGVRTQIELRDKLGLDIEYARPVYVGQKSGIDSGIFGTPVEGVFGADGSGYSTARGGFPLADAKTPSDVEAFAWPDPNDFDYDVLCTLLQKIPNHKAKRIDIKYGIAQQGKSHEESAESGPWIPLICTLFDLFGFEEALVMMSLQPRMIEAAVSKIEEFTLEFARRSLDASRGLADVVFYGDDFATQQGLMISPEK